MKKNGLHEIGEALALATGVGLEIVCQVAIGTFLGRGIDVLLDIMPFGTVLGALAGFVLAMYSIYRRITKIHS